MAGEARPVHGPGPPTTDRLITCSLHSCSMPDPADGRTEYFAVRAGDAMLEVSPHSRPSPRFSTPPHWAASFNSSPTLSGHLHSCAVLIPIAKRLRSRLETRSSAIAEGPRDASCQLKSCQLPRNSAETTYTTSPDQTDGMKLEI